MLGLECAFPAALLVIANQTSQVWFFLQHRHGPLLQSPWVKKCTCIHPVYARTDTHTHARSQPHSLTHRCITCQCTCTHCMQFPFGHILAGRTFLAASYYPFYASHSVVQWPHARACAVHSVSLIGWLGQSLRLRNKYVKVLLSARLAMQE